jgi:hypothetical protein
MEPTVERSGGIATGLGYVVGGGYEGLTPELDAVVADAAQKLAAAFGMDVTIRFNTDRRRGGAWLKTGAVDGVWRNAEVGISASLLLTREEAERKYGRRLDECPDDPHWQEVIERSDGSVEVDAKITEAWLRDPSLVNVPGCEPFAPSYHGSFASVDEAVAFVVANARPPRGQS